MSQRSFSEFIRITFCPFLEKLGFVLEETLVSGRHYRASFVGDRLKIEISFEPGDNYSEVFIFNIGDETFAALEDPARCIRLSGLSNMYEKEVSKLDRIENEEYFREFSPINDTEAGLISAAKRLRLLLPHHLGGSGGAI